MAFNKYFQSAATVPRLEIATDRAVHPENPHCCYLFSYVSSGVTFYMGKKISSQKAHIFPFPLLLHRSCPAKSGQTDRANFCQ